MTLLIGDNQPMLLAGLRTCLSEVGHPVATVTSSAALIEYASTTSIELVVVGFLKDGDCTEMCATVAGLVEMGRGSPILVLSPRAEPHIEVVAEALGASGYVTTLVEPSELREVVRALISGGTWFRQRPDAGCILTAGEMRVLQEYARGTVLKNCSSILGTSLSNVHRCLRNARRRLNVERNGELRSIAAQRCLLSVPPVALAKWDRRRPNSDPSIKARSSH